MGFGVWGLGFGVWGLGFRLRDDVQGLLSLTHTFVQAKFLITTATSTSTFGPNVSLPGFGSVVECRGAVGCSLKPPLKP